MRYLRQNTAVIITVGPFYDKTDGVTIETGLTITNEKITLTADTDDGSAPTNILDNVTGATSGTSNDLNYISGNDAGMMQLELSQANTNRVGRMFLSITDAANHVPVFHEFTVLPANVYDSLILGTDLLQADATQWLGTAITSGSIPAAAAGAAGGLFIAGTNAATTVTTALTTTFTGNLTGTTGGHAVGVDLTAVEKASINAEVVDVLRTDTIPDSYSADGAQPTLAQAVLEMHQFLMERSVTGTTMTVTKPDGTTASMTFTLNDGTSPTAITRAS
jgi:hypothetical protein